jgi:phospholipid N-methyltransferase
MRQRLAETRIFWREFRQTFTSTGAVLPSGTPLAKALARYVGQDSQGQRARHEQQESQGESGSPGPGISSPSPNNRRVDNRRTAATNKYSRKGQSGQARRILEVGPGTGPVTAQIIRQMGPHDTLDLVELNGHFVSVLQDRLQREPRWQRQADRVQIHCQPIEELATDQPFDVIISGLPLNNFSCAMVAAILDRLHQLAAAEAMLSFFEYVAIRKAKSLFCKLPQRLRLAGIEQILARQFAAWEIDRECIVANVPPAWVHHLRLPGKGGDSDRYHGHHLDH